MIFTRPSALRSAVFQPTRVWRGSRRAQTRASESNLKLTMRKKGTWKEESNFSWMITTFLSSSFLYAFLHTHAPPSLLQHLPASLLNHRCPLTAIRRIHPWQLLAMIALQPGSCLAPCADLPPCPWSPVKPATWHWKSCRQHSATNPSEKLQLEFLCSQLKLLLFTQQTKCNF